VSLVSKIIEINDIGPGEHVGYGATHTTTRPVTRVAVVPAGYHDCVPRSFSDHDGTVMVHGHVAPIIGRISMDSMTIDVTDVPGAAVGSDVLIYGRYNDNEILIEEAAGRIGTIPYELMARVGPRVQRILTAHGATARPM
jgi:alanine racemase